MRSFCIVVQRGHEDLYEALRQAFSSRPGFYVLIDRRSPRPPGSRNGRTRERRTAKDEWGGAHFIISDSLEPFGG